MAKPWDVVELIERPKGHSSMSLAEADKLLRTAGYMRDWEYLKDRDFAKFIYLDINSLEDLEAFLVKLDKDNEEHTKPGPFRWGCSKAKGIRSYLTGNNRAFWTGSVERLRLAMAPNRRICCGCHEVGSFKRRDELPVGHEEKFKG